MSSANFKAKLFGCLATKIILFFLFREIQARCRDLTVNQWLGEFDPHTRSQLSVGALCNGSISDFDSESVGSIPTAPAKF